MDTTNVDLRRRYQGKGATVLYYGRKVRPITDVKGVAKKRVGSLARGEIEVGIRGVIPCTKTSSSKKLCGPVPPSVSIF